jgi:hypothetical protein
MAHRDTDASIAGYPPLRHGAVQSSVASLRPVDASRHQKDVMRAECGMEREAGDVLRCDEQYAVLKVIGGCSARHLVNTGVRAATFDSRLIKELLNSNPIEP